MASTRRFMLAFAIATGEGIHHANVTANIDGDLEASIEEIKRRMAEDLARDGIKATAPVLTFALQLENKWPPQYVELPITVRRSIEQIVMDWRRNGHDETPAISEVEVWLESVARG